MADSKKVDQPEITVRRQQDGRHAVIDQHGNILGLHNSPVSAARQVSSYFGQPTAEPTEGEAQIAAAQAAQQQIAAMAQQAQQR